MADGVILVVAKTPLLERLSSSDLTRLEASGAGDLDRLRQGAFEHNQSMAVVRALLKNENVRERRVDDLRSDDGVDAALVITVGGDGTVFTANSICSKAPFLTVNSDPGGSIGFFTRCTAATVADIFAAWKDGHGVIESVPRLQVTIDGVARPILNDGLLANANPAAMCRYVVEVDDQTEHQRSSGMWIATAAGSTAGIGSAGALPIEPHMPALLWRVREPFHGHHPLRLLDGCQTPPRRLRVIPSVPGMALYLDGPYLTVPLAPGQAAEFAPCPQPLPLLVLG